MTTVTPDDVRTLATSGLDHPVMALVNGDVEILAAADAAEGAHVILTREELNKQLGDEVTDVEVDLLAGSLTARLTPTPLPDEG